MQLKFLDKIYKMKYWSGEKLTGNIAFDTETEEITCPSIIPNIVLTTAFDDKENLYIIKNQDLKRYYEINKENNFEVWKAAFDFPVTEKYNYFNFHEHIVKGKVDDGQILFRLLSLAITGQEEKKWSLAFASKKLLGEEIEKNNDIRLTFGQYITYTDNGYFVRYDEIPIEHLQYACLDAVVTKLCTRLIIKEIDKLPTTTKLAQTINLMGDIALTQVTRNGIGVDIPYTENIKNKFEDFKKINADILSTYGYVRGKKGNVKVFEEIVRREGFDLPVTAKGRISGTKEHLEPYKAHPFIEAYLIFKSFEKQNNFLKCLTSDRIYPTYNSIKRTVRTSSSKPNMQNMPRIGGIRECFIPKSGHVFIDCDYSAIELAAIASITKRLFKKSIMADLLNEGRDLHRYAASNIFKIKESKVTKEQRQLAKALNFGLVANMSGTTFVGQAAKYGLVITPEYGEELKEKWAKVFPEMRRYWRYGFGKNTCVTDTGMVRGFCTYTMYLNLQMQLKVAEGAKIALYMLQKEGFKVVAFIHDQVLVEYPREGSLKALERVKEIMIESMSKVIIGVSIGVEGEIKERFEK